MPKSLPLLSGIDFLAEDWADFDSNGQVSAFFEEILTASEIPEAFTRSTAMLHNLLDYCLWRKT
jgi:hypothetical protein